MIELYGLLLLCLCLLRVVDSLLYILVFVFKGAFGSVALDRDRVKVGQMLEK